MFKWEQKTVEFWMWFGWMIDSQLEGKTQRGKKNVKFRLKKKINNVFARHVSLCSAYL